MYNLSKRRGYIPKLGAIKLWHFLKRWSQISQRLWTTPSRLQQLCQNHLRPQFFSLALPVSSAAASLRSSACPERTTACYMSGVVWFSSSTEPAYQEWSLPNRVDMLSTLVHLQSIKAKGLYTKTCTNKTVTFPEKMIIDITEALNNSFKTSTTLPKPPQTPVFQPGLASLISSCITSLICLSREKHCMEQAAWFHKGVDKVNGMVCMD